MKLLIIRHADPDYSVDGLTPTGCREAELLADYLKNVPLDAVYVSPLGRAQKTAEYTLQAKKMTAETLPWLREFNYGADMYGQGKTNSIWDLPPAFYAKDPRLFDTTAWTEIPCIRDSTVLDGYREVTESLDRLLEKHGYRREGLIYRAEQSNKDTVALFCHFGVQSILLSHLLNLPPMPLLHHFCARPSAVTTLVTEEREQGIAQFRCLCYGSVEHLTSVGQKPSFAARFCETFDSPERH